VFRKLSALVITASLGLLAASRAFAPYAAVQPILAQGPAELRNAGEAQWVAWARREDDSIRVRLQQGDLDSMVNLVLYGTSFTRQPRISMEGSGLLEASKSGVLRARVDDLVAGLQNPAGNERLIFLQQLLRDRGVDPGDSKSAGVFVLQNLQRVARERSTFVQHAAEVKPSSPLDRTSLFDRRGLSLDTGIIADFAVEQTLRDLKARGLLSEGRVSRVGVIGPGLDFIDKSEASAYDYYPQQTVQPFALYDSLLRLALAKPGALSLTILDISPRVIRHIQRARERASKGASYPIQLPRDISRPWPSTLIDFWSALGDQIGGAIDPIAPPPIFPGLLTRAVRIRPDIILACHPVDLDIILERLDLPSAERFDLLIATNIFVYYDPFEQSLALENAAAMLKPRGLLLTNDALPAAPSSSMRLAGLTDIALDVSARQAVGWYQKQ
jgi:hypothetical protein